MALPLTHCRFFNAPPLSAGKLKAAPLQSDDGTDLAKEASHSCSRQLSVSLPPTPTAAVTEKHTCRTDVTKVEELGMSTSFESVESRSCSGRSAFPLCLPEFATSSGHADTGEAKAPEDFSVMSASEASESEQEENDEISIVADASSDVLPEALPSRVESPEDSCSRGSGQSILEEGDVVLTEMTTMPFAQFTEPLEMPRDKCSESLLTAIEVALDQEVVRPSGFGVEAAAAVATNVDLLDHQAAEKSQDTKAHSNEHQSSGNFNLPEMPNLDYTQTDSEQGAEPNVEAGHEPQRSQEGTGMVVHATVRPVTAELDVEEGQVKQSHLRTRCLPFRSGEFVAKTRRPSPGTGHTGNSGDSRNRGARAILRRLSCSRSPTYGTYRRRPQSYTAGGRGAVMRDSVVNILCHPAFQAATIAACYR
ncbi:hypothetical protein MTO96_023398 [Rhipicephalus appendiculatus]